MPQRYTNRAGRPIGAALFCAGTAAGAAAGPAAGTRRMRRPRRGLRAGFGRPCSPCLRLRPAPFRLPFRPVPLCPVPVPVSAPVPAASRTCPSPDLSRSVRLRPAAAAAGPLWTDRRDRGRRSYFPATFSYFCPGNGRNQFENAKRNYEKTRSVGLGDSARRAHAAALGGDPDLRRRCDRRRQPDRAALGRVGLRHAGHRDLPLPLGGAGGCDRLWPR